MKEPLWLTRRLIESLHADQIREHGGQPGLRDAGPLESALGRPQHVRSHDRDADLSALAAEYGFGVARNHPFVDGNKRMAFVATNVFLILNGFEIEAPEPEVVEAMLRLAAGGMSRDEFASWIRTGIVAYAGG